MKEITVQELKALRESKADFQLIDVREEYEFDICNLGGELIPMGEVMDKADSISKDKKVVVHCRSGKRSASVIQALEAQHGFTNLYNLKGGVLAWIDEVEPSMTKY
ncbi:MAG: rhodanese-like domain-containing protein [Bacteroidia bacterium]|nr:rhodanese-like domain-containing protein [Bacteroidia bacterium]